jgi:regulator of sigma E protease
MYQLLVSVIAFLIAIGILIAVHEFGHFWVARRFGIKVLRFSIGFGRPLYRWYDKLGTEYVLSAIPLGGYVALFGEQGQTIPPAERSMAFSYKSVWVRMSVLVAGPLFNLLFAVLAYWIIFLMGTTVYVPILGSVTKDSVAGLAGLRSGQEIVSVEGKATNSWEAVSVQLLSHLGEDKTITVGVKEKGKNTIENKTMDFGNWSDKSTRGDWLESIGLSPVDPIPPVIAKVLPDYPAAKAGLQEGDRILSVDKQPVNSRIEIVQAIQPKANKPVTLEILRRDHPLKLVIEPISKPSSDGKENGFIGVEFQALDDIPKELIRTQHFGVVESFTKAVKRTAEYSILTLEVLKKMITGQVSIRHISGPLAIAKYAGQSVSIGLKHFLDFLGMISISLGVLNLLPIPLLDGGHFMYCVYELITGKRVNEAAQSIGVWVGGMILIGFMTLAFYNDLVSIFKF